MQCRVSGGEASSEVGHQGSFGRAAQLPERSHLPSFPRSPAWVGRLPLSCPKGPIRRNKYSISHHVFAAQVAPQLPPAQVDSDQTNSLGATRPEIRWKDGIWSTKTTHWINLSSVLPFSLATEAIARRMFSLLGVGPLNTGTKISTVALEGMLRFGLLASDPLVSDWQGSSLTAS